MAKRTSARGNHVLACNFAKYSPIFSFFHHIQQYKHNFSLMSCFADINVLLGSVATHARCGGIFDNRLTANLPANLPVKTCLKSVKN